MAGASMHAYLTESRLTKLWGRLLRSLLGSDILAALCGFSDLLGKPRLLTAAPAKHGSTTSGSPPSPANAIGERLTKCVALRVEARQPQTREFHVLDPDVWMGQQIGLMVCR